MNTIKSFSKSEIIVKKSKFICLVFPINNKDEVKDILLKIKEEYKDANHYCYAYRTINYEKYDDDKEPSKTAGYPLLEILIKRDLVNILAITIRYFGGIKLGAGGLIRAYQNSLKTTLETTLITPFIKYFYYEITFSYEDENVIKKYFNDEDIIKKEYDLNIKYLIRVNENNKKLLKNILVSDIKEVDLN